MKIVGCFVVVVFSSFVGHLFSEREKARLIVLEELCRFVEKIARGVERRIPLCGIFEDFDKTENPVYLSFCNGAEPTRIFYKIKKEGVCTHEAEMCKELLFSLRKKEDASEIVRQCDDVSLVLHTQLERVRSECAKKRELYLKLGASFGLLICILLI